MSRRFDICFAAEVVSHMRVIERKHHPLIRKHIEQQLRFEPFVETRNRKPLQTEDEVWEIRFGPNNRYRVFYEPKGESAVRVQAIGVKTRNVLRIAGEVVEL